MFSTILVWWLPTNPYVLSINCNFLILQWYRFSLLYSSLFSWLLLIVWYFTLRGMNSLPPLSRQNFGGLFEWLTVFRIYFTRVYEYISIFLWTIVYFNFYFRDSLITFHLALENIFKGITVLRLFYLLPPVGGAALDIFSTSFWIFIHLILPLLIHFYII